MFTPRFALSTSSMVWKKQSQECMQHSRSGKKFKKWRISEFALYMHVTE